ncbi:THUMP domain-containing class I SAM-dependent RNA methyltransferase [Azospira restricta]|uniref:Methyltransferase n=1 Tax=Azospira restricta TaxID=404405 RepID=A0A974SPU7_9RHOO|nr:THUMP domain-containing protein [Azospira restricta]QRJ64225.1 methyltransferase [Azospira restricta]
MNNYFASCPRGLEPLLADDIAALGGQHVKAVGGGVMFAGDWPVCYAVNLHSRLATRVLWRVAARGYATADDIYKLALDTDWTAFFLPTQTLRVDVTAIKSPLKSLDFVTLRVKDGICDRFRRDCGDVRPSIDTRQPDVRVQAFLTEDNCTLYVDTSGDPLWQRGLRQKTVEAPLKENLAAGILRLAGWQPGTPLFDPMCGSGTFLLEAAQIAHGIAPGSRRSFAFERLKGFDAETWRRMREAALAAEKPVAWAQLFGADVSAQAVRAATANLDRAGLLEAVELIQSDILEVAAPADGGILVCNPPYGVRLEEQESLAAFYPQLATALKKNFAGWTCHFFTADLRMPKLMRLTPSRKTPLYNGALECRLFEIRMVAGSNRPAK